MGEIQREISMSHRLHTILWAGAEEETLTETERFVSTINFRCLLLFQRKIEINLLDVQLPAFLSDVYVFIAGLSSG